MIDSALFSEVQIAQDGASWPEHGFTMCCSEQRNGIEGCGVSSLDSMGKHILFVLTKSISFRGLDENVKFMVDNICP